jgi:hypothetical protein
MVRRRQDLAPTKEAPQPYHESPPLHNSYIITRTAAHDSNVWTKDLILGAFGSGVTASLGNHRSILPAAESIFASLPDFTARRPEVRSQAGRVPYSCTYANRTPHLGLPHLSILSSGHPPFSATQHPLHSQTIDHFSSDRDEKLAFLATIRLMPSPLDEFLLIIFQPKFATPLSRSDNLRHYHIFGSVGS